VTHLYYDANTTYYYDASAKKFLYWDAVEQNYLALAQQPLVPPALPLIGDGGDKKDKAKVAKKIAKVSSRVITNIFLSLPNV
jgi:hypothetical protein